MTGILKKAVQQDRIVLLGFVVVCCCEKKDKTVFFSGTRFHLYSKHAFKFRGITKEEP